MTDPGVTRPFAATYILPLRWRADEGLEELAGYLDQLSRWIPVIVVDGSSPALFQAHAKAFPAGVRHIPPRARPGANGKVAGVVTGVEAAETELLVLADDDVRYEKASLEHVLSLLADAEIVRPQNYFLTLPWHARLDTARSLINRAFGADYPGTFGVRRSALLATGGYDGDVLFENLELLRTLKAAGGRETMANSLFVGRTAPSVRHFVGQRIRQAYDDFAQPGRLAMELSLLPLVVATVYAALDRRRPTPVLAVTALACATAEIGRRRNNGTQVFASTAALWAPAWLLERSLCIWAALAFRAAGGVPYAGGRLSKAANSPHHLRRIHQGKITAHLTEGLLQ
jgi:hypothetical protein